MTGPSDYRGYISDIAQRHGALVISQAIVAIANTTANAFAMIYLLNVGFDYIECSVFLLVGFATAMLMTTVFAGVVVRDYVRSMILGMCSMAVYYVLLVLLDGPALMLVPPVFLGIYIVMFWVPYNSVISRVTTEENRGTGIGAYFLVFPAVSTVGPLVGGMMIAYGSYDLLLSFGAVTIGTNIVFLLASKAFRGRNGTWNAGAQVHGSPFRFVREVDRKVGRGMLLEGVQEGVFWMALSVLSFEYATDEAELGGYLSLFAFWGALMTVALGYLSDRIGDRVKILRISAALTAVALVVCAIATNSETYLTGMSFASFWLAVVPAFLFAMLVDRTRDSPTKGMMGREFLLNSGRALGLFVTVVLLLLDFDLSISMAVAAVAIAAIITVR